MNNKIRITSGSVKALIMRAGIVGGLCMVLMTGLAQGTMMYDQQGATNPGTLNYLMYSGVTVDSVTNDLGHDAWNINTSLATDGSFAYYNPTLTGGQWTTLTNSGWKLTADLRVLADAMSGTNINYGMAVTTAPLGFSMAFGLNAATNTVVYVNGVLASTITDGGYHSYVLSDANHDGFADLYVDGVLKESSIAAGTKSGSTLLFGDLTAAHLNNGSANYSLITLETFPIPEASTLGLFGIGGLLLLRRRQKKVAGR